MCGLRKTRWTRTRRRGIYFAIALDIGSGMSDSTLWVLVVRIKALHIVVRLIGQLDLAWMLLTSATP